MIEITVRCEGEDRRILDYKSNEDKDVVGEPIKTFEVKGRAHIEGVIVKVTNIAIH